MRPNATWWNIVCVGQLRVGHVDFMFASFFVCVGQPMRMRFFVEYGL